MANINYPDINLPSVPNVCSALNLEDTGRDNYEFTETKCFLNGYYYGDIVLLDRDLKVIEVRVQPSQATPFIRKFIFTGEVVEITQHPVTEE